MTPIMIECTVIRGEDGSCTAAVIVTRGDAETRITSSLATESVSVMAQWAGEQVGDAIRYHMGRG